MFLSWTPHGRSNGCSRCVSRVIAPYAQHTISNCRCKDWGVAVDYAMLSRQQFSPKDHYTPMSMISGPGYSTDFALRATPNAYFGWDKEQTWLITLRETQTDGERGAQSSQPVRGTGSTLGWSKRGSERPKRQNTQKRDACRLQAGCLHQVMNMVALQRW